jgi:hypothetical protein
VSLDSPVEGVGAKNDLCSTLPISEFPHLEEIIVRAGRLDPAGIARHFDITDTLDARCHR